MGKKRVILILMVVILVLAGMAAFYYIRNMVHSKEAYPQLQGEWTEVNSVSTDTFTFKNGSFLYFEGEEEQECTFQVEEGENYNLNLENALTISFEQNEGPWYGELVYHTQQVDGHPIHILSSFLYEDDGRGLIVGCEFVRNDDLRYVESDFCSELYDSLNKKEASPTYAEQTADE